MRRYKKLDDHLSIERIFLTFAKDKHCFFLDSSLESESLGRFSFIGSEPGEVIEFIEGMEKPFEKLRGDFEAAGIFSGKEGAIEDQFPFTGGFVGYLSYDLGRYIERISNTAETDIEIPYYWFGKYDNIIAIDNLKREVWLVINGSSEEELDLIEKKMIKKIIDAMSEYAAEDSIEVDVEDLSKTSCENPFENVVDIYDDYSDTVRAAALDAEKIGLLSNLTTEQFIASVNRIREYIKAGDVYQVNMTQRFAMETARTAVDIYSELRIRNSAPFASYLDFSNKQDKRYILSSSPERLLKYENGIAESRPIKGTLPRGKTPEEDMKLSMILKNSEKDRAELLMIVDLVRNDLGKVAKSGTVKVSQLFHVEQYATVHHLVSSVCCELDEGKDQIDLLEAVFPGGSITGAPKIRAMEIIDELEPTRRNIYTGSLGYISNNGNMDFNILIRTILKLNNKAYYQVGGGIVWDSDPSAEYDETLHKGKAIMKTLTGF